MWKFLVSHPSGRHSNSWPPQMHQMSCFRTYASRLSTSPPNPYDHPCKCKLISLPITTNPTNSKRKFHLLRDPHFFILQTEKVRLFCEPSKSKTINRFLPLNFTCIIEISWANCFSKFEQHPNVLYNLLLALEFCFIIFSFVTTRILIIDFEWKIFNDTNHFYSSKINKSKRFFYNSKKTKFRFFGKYRKNSFQWHLVTSSLVFFQIIAEELMN